MTSDGPTRAADGRIAAPDVVAGAVDLFDPIAASRCAPGPPLDSVIEWTADR